MGRWGIRVGARSRCQVSVPGALNYFIFYRPIQSILSASRNPILTALPLSGFLDSLLCVLIAPTPGLAFSFLIPRTQAAALSFSSGKAYLFLNFLPPLSSLDPYSDYVGTNISLNNSSSLSFLNVYAPPIRSSPTDGRTDSFSPSILPSSRNLFILGDFNCHHLLWDSRVTSDPAGRKYSTGSSPLTSSPSMTLTHSPFSIAPLAVVPLLTSPLLLLLLPFLAPERCFRTWVLTTSQFFYLSHSLRSFAPMRTPLPLIFRKLAGMGLPPTLTLIVLQQRNTRLFLFPLLLLLYLSLAKPGGLLRWKVRLVKDARLLLPLTEVMKIARLTFPLLDVPRQSSPRPRRKHYRRLALLSHLGLTLNLYTLFFALSLALLPRLPPLLISPTVLLPGNRLRSMPLTWDPTFPFLSQRPCIAEPEATSPSSAEPRALWSLTRSFALLSLSLNFLRLPPILPPPPPLAQQSFLSYTKAPSSLWHGFSSSHLQSFLVFAFLSFHLENIFHYSHTQDGKASRLSCFLPAYLPHLLRIKAV